jgi:hypothetical protein
MFASGSELLKYEPSGFLYFFSNPCDIPSEEFTVKTANAIINFIFIVLFIKI